MIWSTKTMDLASRKDQCGMTSLCPENNNSRSKPETCRDFSQPMATHPPQPDCDDRINHPARNVPGAPNCSSTGTTPANAWWTRRDCFVGVRSTNHGAAHQICGGCDNVTQTHPSVVQALADPILISPQPQAILWGAPGGAGPPNTWTARFTRLCSSCANQERMKYWHWCHNYGGPDEYGARMVIAGGSARATWKRYVVWFLTDRGGYSCCVGGLAEVANAGF